MRRWRWETWWLLIWIVGGYLASLTVGVLFDDVACVASEARDWVLTLCLLGVLIYALGGVIWGLGAVFLGYIWFTRPRNRPRLPFWPPDRR